MSKNRITYKHNDLFRPDAAAWDLNACVGTNGGPYGFADYALGYFNAGERLVKSLESDRGLIDILVYPLTFTYRHAIELSLKHFCQELPTIWGEKDGPKFSHTLIDNWETAKRYLVREKTFDPDGDVVPTIDIILHDFITIDPNGEVFRFPGSKRGDMHLEKTTHINLRVFSEAMLFVADVFKLWFHGLDEMSEARAEE